MKILWILDANVPNSVLTSLSDAINWNQNKVVITAMVVETTSTNWDLTIYPDSDQTSGIYHSMSIQTAQSGNKSFMMYLPYIDNDGLGRVHILFVDNSGSNAATVSIYGIKAT